MFGLLPVSLAFIGKLSTGKSFWQIVLRCHRSILEA